MKENNNEVWKPVLGYEGLYEFSNKQRVRSIDRYVATKGNGKRLSKGKLLTISPTQDGYLSVNLSKNGKSKTVYIHQLAWEYFNGMKVPEGMDVNHKDSNRQNNDPSNLEIVTHRANCNTVDTQGKTPAQKRWENPAWVKHINNLHKSARKPIVITHLATGTQFFFDSVTEACDFANLDRSGIKNVAVGKQHQTHGWITEYLDYDPEIMMKAYWMEVVKGLEA